MLGHPLWPSFLGPSPPEDRWRETLPFLHHTGGEVAERSEVGRGETRPTTTLDRRRCSVLWFCAAMILPPPEFPCLRYRSETQVERIREFCSVRELRDVLQRRICDLDQRFFGEECLVPCYQHIREGEKA